MYNNIKYLILGFIAATALALPSGASAADIFAELAGRTQVESTYVSGRFAHNMKIWRSKDYIHSIDLSRGFSALYSYECYSEDDVKDARRILNNYLKKDPSVELVMRTREGSGEYAVYEKFNSEEKLLQMIIWNSSSPSHCELVVIDWKKGLAPSKPKEETDL